jgi:4-amino-4-deoxy-L-arabinose transferase-like glycosyltransferase
MIDYKSVRFNFRLPLELVLVFFLGLFVSLVGLNNHEFVGFESRFGLFAQEMLRNGISFFPTTYNNFYPDYPATQTILTYLFSLPAHKVTIFTAVLPTAIATSITLTFTYLIGLTQSKRWGLYAVLFSLFTFAFVFAARTISLDQFCAAATVASFYYAYSAKLYQKSQRLWWIPICLILGFAFRGPIGLILPASVVGGFYLAEKDYKKLALTAVGAFILLLLCMLVLLAAAWHDGGTVLVNKVLSMQITSRVGDHLRAPPFYYYLKNIFSSYALSFPIACLVMLGIFSVGWTKERFRLLRHLAVWVLIIVIGMSIPGDKKIRYILAITPAIALIAAYLLSEPQQQRWLSLARVALCKLCLLLPFLGLIALTLIGYLSQQQHVDLGIYYFTAIALFMAQIIAVKVIKHVEVDRELCSFIIGVAAFLTSYICIAQPINISFNQTKPFVTQAEALRTSQQALVFYRLGPDGDDIKYMVTADQPLHPQFLQTPTALLNFKTAAIFITAQNQFASLPSNLQKQFQILLIGRLGHTPCVVFTQANAATTVSIPLAR